MTEQLETYLNSLVRGEGAVDWRSNPGYGMMEYTVEFQQLNREILKAFAKEVSKKFNAFDFSTYQDGNLSVLKFLIKL